MKDVALLKMKVSCKRRELDVGTKYNTNAPSERRLSALFVNRMMCFLLVLAQAHVGTTVFAVILFEAVHAIFKNICTFTYSAFVRFLDHVAYIIITYFSSTLPTMCLSVISFS